MESFTPWDSKESDSEHNKLLRAIIKEPITTEDDTPFTATEIREDKSPKGKRYNERHSPPSLQPDAKVYNSYVQWVLEDGLLSQAMEVSDNNSNS
jgi:hypothetical protein